MNKEKINGEMKGNYKKSPNKNLVLATLGIVALIILIIFSLISKKKEVVEIPSYQTVEENKSPSNQPSEPFSSIDIDGDGKEEQVPREIVESKILMLTEDNKLYIISPIDKEKKLLIDGVSAYASSTDKNYIAYLKNCLLTGDQTKCDKDIHIYNLKTNQEFNIPAGQDTQRNISWSPDGRYVIVESGTSIMGSNRTYSVETRRDSGCVFGGDVLWLNNNEFLTNSFLNNLTPRPGQLIYAKGVRKGNIENCIFDEFLLPTDTEDYSANKILEGEVVIQKDYVDKPEDWDNFSDGSKIKTTYEKYNLQTKQSIPYPEYADEIKSKNDRLKSLVPFDVRVKRIFTSDKDISAEWELINAYKGGSLYNNEIYLIGPDKTVVKIGENAFGTWL